MMLKLKPFMRAHTWDNKAMCYNMCINNMHSLYAANNILKSDAFHVFYAIVRIVFESFPKLFYCMADKEGAMHVFCCEEFFYDRKAALRSDKDVESYCKCVERLIDSENCKYVKDLKWFRKEVYTNDRQHVFNKQYALYSVGSHPNIVTIDATTRGELKYGWTTSLEIITCYSLMWTGKLVAPGKKWRLRLN